MKKLKALFIVALIMLFLAPTIYASSPSTLKRNVWNAKQTFKHEVEFDGVVDLSDATVTGTGVISSTNIADVDRTIQLPLMGGIINDSGTLSLLALKVASVPGVAIYDGIHAIAWGDATETSSVGWTFELPAEYTSTLGFRMLVSSDTDTSPASWGFDWQMYVNKGAADGGPGFGAVLAQTRVVLPATASPSVSPVLLEFTPSASAVEALAAGAGVTVYFWPYDERASGTIELKSVAGRYTAVQ